MKILLRQNIYYAHAFHGTHIYQLTGGKTTESIECRATGRQKREKLNIHKAQRKNNKIKGKTSSTISQ